MRRLVATVVLVAGAACRRDAPALPPAAEVADRGWHAHEEVVAAGEHAQTCAAAGVAMEAAFAARRQAFVDAVALDNDRARLAEATAFLEAHEGRYGDLETRMAALADRCADDPAVAAVFRQMESP
jgi:hypothetical protein